MLVTLTPEVTRAAACSVQQPTPDHLGIPHLFCLVDNLGYDDQQRKVDNGGAAVCQVLVRLWLVFRMIRKRFPVLAGETLTLPLPLLGLSQSFCPRSKHNRNGPIYFA